MIELKPATPDDWETIQQIAHNTWPDTFGAIIAQEQLEYMLASIYNEKSLRNQMLALRHHFLLALKDAVPVGFASYELNYDDKPQVMIHKIYLLPTSQGLGIGKKIFDHLMDVAKSSNSKTLRLKVFNKNDKAMGFYRKYGFKIIGTETTDIGNGFIVVDNVMTRELE